MLMTGDGANDIVLPKLIIIPSCFLHILQQIQQNLQRNDGVHVWDEIWAACYTPRSSIPRYSKIPSNCDLWLVMSQYMKIMQTIYPSVTTLYPTKSRYPQYIHTIFPLP